MMYSYPFFSFPRFRRYTASTTPPAQVPYSNYVPHPSYANVPASNRPFVATPNPYAHSISSTVSNQRKEEKENRENSACNADLKEDNPFFEIFGIKLYYDDILLICLIFFLYQEDVDDPYLFIALILLLLT